MTDSRRLRAPLQDPVELVPRSVNESAWRPFLYRGNLPNECDALLKLVNSDDVREVHDTLDRQLEDLIRDRSPARAFTGTQLQAAKQEHLAGIEPWQYGTWVWYPWSGRLVHVLPRDEFRALRTDRNRGKISPADQARLLDYRIGIIGLSVGSSVALTLAMEGIGGKFKLADFDELGLSNLNRLRTGVHDLGINKTVIAARQMYEIDPYLDIEIYPDGLTEINLEVFFCGGSGPLDLLVEECDTPWVKVAARELARSNRVPVLMDTNDRGMLDIERFDLEPDRPLLHGLLGQTSSQELRNLGPEERMALVLSFIGKEGMSAELGASFERIGETLNSWPQLASGVVLGAAITTDAARRILLGTHRHSGRYYVDLAALLADKATASHS
ncbi:ThiF family adenylyltransferase [Streptomyces sp. NPDC048419]|uniref:ThiF family adenylyltransferase n=1 Tax=Streptomyces sp. NPDC048419 TaxID=3365547 RepID=UPI003719B3F2